MAAKEANAAIRSLITAGIPEQVISSKLADAVGKYLTIHQQLDHERKMYPKLKRPIALLDQLLKARNNRGRIRAPCMETSDRANPG
jgi:hypothetical protein